VPVFSLVPKGVKGAPKDIDEADLRTAIQIHQRAYHEDKALCRLNVLHNFGIHKATGVGFFLPKFIRPLRMRGKSKPAIFADLLSVKDEWFQALDQNDLPYCSVEIRNWQPLEFACLALLDTEPPFFNGFPNITIGDRHETVSVSAELTRFHATEQAPAVAAFVSGSGARFLFRFEQEDEMPDEEKKDDEMDIVAAVKAIQAVLKDMEPLIALKDDIAALVAGGEMEPEAEAEGEALPIETEEEAKSEGPVELGAGTDDEAEPDEEEDEDEDKKKMPFSASATKTDARLSALEDFKAKTEREKTRDAAFSEATTSLEGEGFCLSEGSRKRLFRAAEQGTEALALFMEEYRDTAPKDPPADLDGLPPSEEAWPSEVMAFSAQGPDAFTEAKHVYREWNELHQSKAFGGTVTSLDKYLARNLQKGG